MAITYVFNPFVGNFDAIDTDPSSFSTDKFGITLDGGGGVISTGIKGDVKIPYAHTITGWDLLADQVGSCVIDVWADTYGNYPPTVADTIFGTKPALSSVIKNQATGLSIAGAAGTIYRFNVDSASTITRVVLSFTVTKT